MAVEQILFPDIEPVIVAHMAALVPAVWSCLELPPVEEFEANLPVAQYTRIGGVPAIPTWGRGRLADAPNIDVDVYAPSRQAANEAVRELRQALARIAGTVRDGAAFQSCTEIAGPALRPDVSQGITRIGWTVAMTVRPTGP